jgi:hypothetical protein
MKSLHDRIAATLPTREFQHRSRIGPNAPFTSAVRLGGKQKTGPKNLGQVTLLEWFILHRPLQWV